MAHSFQYASYSPDLSTERQLLVFLKLQPPFDKEEPHAEKRKERYIGEERIIPETLSKARKSDVSRAG
jgi:hypothetical protein